MSETFGSRFNFGSYTDEESKEVPQTQEMKEAPSDKDTQEFTRMWNAFSDKDTQEFTSEIQAPEPKKPAALAPRYEISQRPLRAKKCR